MRVVVLGLALAASLVPAVARADDPNDPAMRTAAARERDREQIRQLNRNELAYVRQRDARDAQGWAEWRAAHGDRDSDTTEAAAPRDVQVETQAPAQQDEAQPRDEQGQDQARDVQDEPQTRDPQDDTPARDEQEAARARYEQDRAQARYDRDEAQARYARQRAQYARQRAQYARDMADWRDQVAACRAGDYDACAQ